MEHCCRGACTNANLAVNDHVLSGTPEIHRSCLCCTEVQNPIGYRINKRTNLQEKIPAGECGIRAVVIEKRIANTGSSDKFRESVYCARANDLCGGGRRRDVSFLIVSRAYLLKFYNGISLCCLPTGSKICSAIMINTIIVTSPSIFIYHPVFSIG